MSAVSVQNIFTTHTHRKYLQPNNSRNEDHTEKRKKETPKSLEDRVPKRLIS